MRLITSIVAASLIIVAVAGCSRRGAPGTPYIIPVNIWVVLGPVTDRTPDQSGVGNNRGCRLNRAQITEYIDKLNDNGKSLFGVDVRFVSPRENPNDPQSNYVFNIVYDSGVPTSGANRRESPTTFLNNVVFRENRNGAYNIFFTGFVSNPPDANGIASAGITSDPGGSSVYYFTLINDNQRNNNGPG